jgi:hypothetical protein
VREAAAVKRPTAVFLSSSARHSSLITAYFASADSHPCERLAIPHSGHTDSLNGKSELALHVQALRGKSQDGDISADSTGSKG